jgi:hypothetical protein
VRYVIYIYDVSRLRVNSRFGCRRRTRSIHDELISIHSFVKTFKNLRTQNMSKLRYLTQKTSTLFLEHGYLYERC